MSARIRWTCLTLASLFWAGLLVGDAAAQLTNTTGMGGTSSTGSFGSRTLGGSSTSANRTGRSTGASNATTGQGGTGTASGALGSGAPTGERYMRGTQKGFVGADSSDGALNSYSGMTGGMNGMNGAMGNQMMQSLRQNQQRTQQNQNQNQQAKQQVRIPFRVDSIAAPRLTTTFTSRMTTRYANLPALKGKSKIAMVMEGDTLVLQGQVQSAADRKLAEDLLSLEPGVNLVRNELTVVPQELPIPVSTLAPRSETETVSSVVPASAQSSAPKRVSQPLER